MPRLAKNLLDRAELAVIEAGYSPKLARRRASHMLRHYDFPAVVLQRMFRMQSTASELQKRLADIFLEEEARIGVVHHECSLEFERLNTVAAPSPRRNQRHIRFAVGLGLFGWNQTKAAIYAGYSPLWAGTNTSRIMKHPSVQSEIAQIRSHLTG